MRCPICGKDHDKVVDSRSAQGGNIVRRRRKCLQCGNKFTTYEEIEHAPLYVIKKDNRRELFQREKLFQGIVTACKKRPVSMEAIEQLIHAIEMSLRSEFQTEIPAWKIGEFVMEGLKQLDDVAYVRFASVYRQFKDAEEFIEELRKLKTEQENKRAAKQTQGLRKTKETGEENTLPLFS